MDWGSFFWYLIGVGVIAVFAYQLAREFISLLCIALVVLAALTAYWLGNKLGVPPLLATLLCGVGATVVGFSFFLMEDLTELQKKVEQLRKWADGVDDEE